MGDFDIDHDVKKASTLPGAVYGDPATHARLVERLFPRSWHAVLDAELVGEPGRLAPAPLLDGCLNEPLMFARDAGGELRCLSNVCTHRGALLVSEPCKAQSIRCRYHGRRFSLDGRFSHMPEFEGAVGFPSAADDLPRVPFGQLGPVLFASLDPAVPFSDLVAPLLPRLGALLDRPSRFDAATSRDYEVRANWALYCDNYLEGFHIPFVHPSLTEALDYGAYETETFAWGSIQIGVAKPGEAVLDLGAEHPDADKCIAGYYAWLFPATMLNVYPWGLSLNAIRPLGPDRTLVSFRSYVSDPAKRAQGAGGDLHSVELEDEAVVESVQRGVRSRLYKRGRFSPTREAGVHHFHRLLSGYLG